MARPKEKDDKKRKFYLSQKQLDKIKKDAVEEAVSKSELLTIVTLADRGWSEDELADLFEDICKNSEYIDKRIVTMRQVQRMIKEKTGIIIKGKW